MKRILSVLSVLVISSAALLAQSNAISSMDSEKATQSPAALTKHLLKGTYVSVGFGPALGGGFVAIDAANNVVCPGTSGNCLIQADQVMQVASGSANNRVALCFYVDGSPVDGCPFNGDTLANGHFASYSYSHGITVAHGTHSVQTVIFTDFASTGANYTFQYKVYKP
jgi:hypothetical protein